MELHRAHVGPVGSADDGKSEGVHVMVRSSAVGHTGRCCAPGRAELREGGSRADALRVVAENGAHLCSGVGAMPIPSRRVGAWLRAN